MTPELACFMENIDEPDYETLRVLYESAQHILYSDQKAEPFYQQEFFADNRLLGYLNGDCRIDDRLEDLAELFDGTGNGLGGQKGEELLPLMIREPACKELGQLLSDRSEDIWLRGNDGIGKRHLLRHALRKCGKSMLFVDAKAILEHTKQEQKLIWLVRREALLLGCDVCIYGISGALLGLDLWGKAGNLNAFSGLGAVLGMAKGTYDAVQANKDVQRQEQTKQNFQEKGQSRFARTQQNAETVSKVARLEGIVDIGSALATPLLAIAGLGGFAYTVAKIAVGVAVKKIGGTLIRSGSKKQILQSPVPQAN